MRHASIAPIVWGGIHPSLEPEQTARHACADIVVVGEGETTFLELLEALRHGSPLDGVAGLCFERDGVVVRTPPRRFEDLDALPEVPYELVDVRGSTRAAGLGHVGGAVSATKTRFWPSDHRATTVRLIISTASGHWLSAPAALT